MSYSHHRVDFFKGIYYASPGINQYFPVILQLLQPTFYSKSCIIEDQKASFVTERNCYKQMKTTYK